MEAKGTGTTRLIGQPETVVLSLEVLEQGRSLEASLVSQGTGGERRYVRFVWECVALSPEL